MDQSQRAQRRPGDGSDSLCEEVQDVLQRQLCEVARRAGFKFFLMVELPRADKTTFADNLVATNWPDALVRLYEKADLFFYSHLVAAFRKTIMPVELASNAFSGRAANQENAELNSMIQRLGIERTFALTLHDLNLKQYIFAFSGVRGALSRDESANFSFAVSEILERHGSRHDTKDGPLEGLSPRELQCLRWSAAGKSGEEIAIILSLSSHTVVAYLKSAIRKLGSVNRMQAIARACRYRIL